MQDIDFLCGNTTSRFPMFALQASAMNLLRASISGCSHSGGGSIIQAVTRSIINIQQSVFQNIRSGGIGGAFSVTGSNITLWNSTLIKISSDIGGGAVSAFAGSNVTIVSTKFRQVSTPGQGGVFSTQGSRMYIMYCTFEDYSSGGSGYFAFTSAGSVTDIDSAKLSCGTKAPGPIFVIQSSNLSIFNSTLSDCSSVTDGTIILASENSVIRLNMIDFRNIRSSGSGGCISMTSSAVSITDSFFDNVSCTGGGSIIWAISNSLVVLNSIQQTCDSRIISTSSFKVQGTIIEMFNSSFFGCTSSTDGSIVQSYDNAIVNVSKSTFSSLSSLG